MNGYGGRIEYNQNSVHTPKKSGGAGKILLIILFALIWIAIIAGVVMIVRMSSEGGGDVTTDPTVTTDAIVTDDPSVTTEGDGTTAPVTDPAGPATLGGLTLKDAPISSSMIYTGDLILVNGSHAYNFDANKSVENSLVPAYDYWIQPSVTYSYEIHEGKLTNRIHVAMATMFDAFLEETKPLTADGKGLNDYCITDGYRTYEEQENVLNNKIAAVGETAAYKTVAKPGYSEHHTGLAIDLKVYVNDKVKPVNYSLGAKDTPEVYNWIFDNSYKYGWILRYAANKTEVTGFDHEPWHFRYVGAPHATYMYQNGICLEEYITLLTAEHGVDAPLTVECGSDTYAVYYQPAAYEQIFTPEIKDEAGNVITPAGSTTQLASTTTLRIPEDAEYTVSGTNIDGFVITVKLS